MIDGHQVVPGSTRRLVLTGRELRHLVRVRRARLVRPDLYETPPTAGGAYVQRIRTVRIASERYAVTSQLWAAPPELRRLEHLRWRAGHA